MKLITAVIKPAMVDAVKDALKQAGATGITLTEVKGFGRQGGHTELYRGTEYLIDFLPKVRLDLVVADEDADQIAEVIATAARTGKIGDGKIWIGPIDKVIRIRTDERDADAL